LYAVQRDLVCAGGAAQVEKLQVRGPSGHAVRTARDPASAVQECPARRHLLAVLAPADHGSLADIGGSERDHEPVAPAFRAP
jgi:hypothetical protein